MDFSDRIYDTIRRTHMFDGCAGCVLAVSGGPDSMAMLSFFIANRQLLGFPFAVAHVNHGLRVESDEEQRMLEAYCAENNVDINVIKPDIKGDCPKGMSVETYSRKIRYDFFENMRSEHSWTHIATAHTADDNIETFFMHLARGSAMNGLKGISPLRDGHIARPLIEISKKDILSYCSEKKLPYATDKTNFESIYTRNIFRNDILPLLTKQNPSLSSAILRTEASLSADDEYLCYEAKKALEKIKLSETEISVKEATKLHVSVLTRCIRLFFSALSSSFLSYSNTVDLTDLIYNKGTSSAVSLPDGITAKKGYDKVSFLYNDTEDKQISPFDALPGIYELPAGRFTVKKVTRGADIDNTDGHGITVRSKKSGDSVCIRRSAGTKTLKKLFSDAKIPLSERNAIPVAEMNGKTVFVLGFGTDISVKHGGAGIKFFLEKK